MNRCREVVAALLILRLGAVLGLSALNRAKVRRHAAGAPSPEVAAIMDPPTRRKAAAYALAKSRFGSVAEIFDAAVLAFAVFSGVLPAIHARVAAWGPPEAAWTGACFILAVAAALSVLALPFDAWEQFGVEAEFGFNRTTPGLWAADKLKSASVGLCIGFPLLWALLALARRAGEFWWIWGWALAFGIQLAMFVVYPRFILPIFNRLDPLPEGELRSSLLALGERTGFRAASIHVMDGSRRSSHSNAFFTGFGRLRRIVLFDTLVAQLPSDELAAVLAHEIGHYRRGHVPKRLALSAAGLAAGFAAIAWLARAPWFNPAFGFPSGAMAPAFLLFGLLGGLVLFWVSPFSNLLSRRHEYEADAFAREAMGGPGAVVGALRKLAGNNLSNLTPHPWFGAFYHSHPTVAERERALNRGPL